MSSMIASGFSCLECSKADQAPSWQQQTRITCQFRKIAKNRQFRSQAWLICVVKNGANPLVERKGDCVTDQYETDRRQQDPDQPMAEARVPMFNVPTVILVLIGLFALVHFGRSLLTPGQDLTFLIEMAFIPARYVDGLLASGLAGFTSFVTYNFLHGDVTHLGVNSIWMLAMGSAVAKRLGAWRFLAFSLVCSLFAAFAHLLTHWGELVPVIGASGAVSGHMAAAIRFIFSVPDHGHVNEEGRGELWAVPMKTLTETLKDSRVLGVLAIWLLMNILSGIGVLSMGQGDNPIAWEAHIGGFLAGLLLFSLFDHPKEPIDPTFDQNRGSS